MEEFIETLRAVKKLQHHDFIAYMQANYVNEAKKISDLMNVAFTGL